MNKELKIRTLTGIGLIIIIGAALVLGNIYFWLTTLLLSTLFYREYHNIYKNKKSRGFFFSTGLIGILYYIGLYYGIEYSLQISLLLLLIYGEFGEKKKFPE